MKLFKFLTTLGIGAVAGMLLAPKKGSELRNELKEKGKETFDTAKNMPTGLVQKDHYYLGNNITEIPVDENLFANDSHCMINLKSATLGLYEKGTGRGVVCNIEEFPYTLLWSKKGMPRFVCIEPWQSLPSYEGGSINWDEKPAAAVLKPGEAWSTILSTSFVR